MTSVWCVYIICCSDNSLYTGITTDINRRFHQHQEGRGAKYFRARKPLRVVFLEEGHSRSSAIRREIEIKKMSRAEKMLLQNIRREPAVYQLKLSSTTLTPSGVVLRENLCI